jgi:hypothetical protein
LIHASNSANRPSIHACGRPDWGDTCAPSPHRPILSTTAQHHDSTTAQQHTWDTWFSRVVAELRSSVPTLLATDF